MVRYIDLTNQVFGELTALSYNPGTRCDPSTWTCQCSCGNLINVPAFALRAGNYKSCGCKRVAKLHEGVKKHIKSDRVDGTRKTALKAKMHKDNKLGIKGVIWMESRKKYKAYIGFKGKQISLGHYDNLEDAIDARKRGEELYHKPILEDDENE